MTTSSGKKPYLYGEYLKASQTPMESEIYPAAPERESQFKKPYLRANHPLSEQEYSPPDLPGFGIPRFPWAPTGADCTPQGAAIGGGAKDPCDPSENCGVWDYACCHKVISWKALGGSIKSVTNTGNDTCRVIACWGGEKGKLQIVAAMQNGKEVIVFGDKKACACPDHDPLCISCPDCISKGKAPVISYTSQQMSCSGVQNLSASGGGGGPYTWSTTSGTFSTTKTWRAGQTTQFTAPSTNAECASNPTITVKDCCDQSATLQIAANCWTGIRAAYSTCTNNCPFTNACARSMTCNSVLSDVTIGCECMPGALCRTNPVCSGSCEGLACGSFVDGKCCGYQGITCPYSIYDVRTAAMKTGGCCPAGLL